MDNFNSSEDNKLSNIVSARGTGNGVVIRIQGETDENLILSALKEYVGARRSFLSGNQVTLEWVSAVPQDSLVQTVTALLKEDFDVRVKSGSEVASTGNLKISKTTSFIPPRQESQKFADPKVEGKGLLGGIESIKDSFDINAEPETKISKPQSSYSNSMFWDNPDAMIMHATLRSGQKIETEHSLVLVGDVNHGGEIVAGGDVIVLGTLRGVVHAGAYDESGGGRFIFALDLRPTQLRIGSIISRGAENNQKIPEIAFVDNNAIVVEPYNSRMAANKGR